MTMTGERRAARRVPVYCATGYSVPGPMSNADWRATRVVDLSAGGACLEAVEPLTPGSELAFQILTADQHAVNVRAQVVHLDSREYRSYHLGVRFTALSASGRAILARAMLRAVA